MTTHHSADSPARPAPLRTRHAGRHGAIRRRARGGLPLGFEIAPVVGEETDQPTWVVLKGGRDRPVAFLERLPGRPRWIATLPEIWASQTDPAERAAHALVTAPSRARAAAAAIEALGVTFEGVLRAWQPSLAPGEEGRPRDTAMFAMTPEQWPGVRARLVERIERRSTSSKG